MTTRGRPPGPTVDRLRSIDADALASAVVVRATLAGSVLTRALGWQVVTTPSHNCPLAQDVRWVRAAAIGGYVYATSGEADIALDAIEDTLRGVDLPGEWHVVVSAARARLSLAQGRAVELAPLALLGGVSLAKARADVQSGALKTRKAAGRVTVAAGVAQAWLSKREATAAVMRAPSIRAHSARR